VKSLLSLWKRNLEILCRVFLSIFMLYIILSMFLMNIVSTWSIS